jgi:putative FmdB family regulatory protein
LKGFQKMPTYNSKCPQCNQEFEYFCKISDRETSLPDCPTCKDEKGQPVKCEVALTLNKDGGFILKGTGWFGHSSRKDKKGY